MSTGSSPKIESTSENDQTNIPVQLDSPEELSPEESERIRQELADNQRIAKARKSLTRSNKIDLSFDDLPELCKPNLDLPDACPSSDKPASDDFLKQELSPLLLSPNDAQKTDISSSLEVIGVDKFALENRRLSRILHRAFVNPDIENLFQIYHDRQKRHDFFLPLSTGILLSVYSILLVYLKHSSMPTPVVSPVIPAASTLTPIISPTTIVISYLSVAILLHLVGLVVPHLTSFPDRGWNLLPYFFGVVLTGQLALLVLFGPVEVMPREGFSWLLLLTFLFFAVLPVRFIRIAVVTVLMVLAYYVSSVVAHGAQAPIMQVRSI